jgi:O-methyltransferase involved in polyketide biosynthesis
VVSCAMTPRGTRSGEVLAQPVTSAAPVRAAASSALADVRPMPLRRRLTGCVLNGPMPDKRSAELGDVQQTLFVPLSARAAETRRRHPALRDPKAVEIVDSVDFAAVYAANWGGFVMVTRTLIFDGWVREFLREHPAGTVVELGTGLNTRFDRLDNGQCHWVDLDLPDVIALRRRFFADAGRRQMVAASVLDDDWHDLVAACPSPYFFVAEGVLPYLEEAPMTSSLAAIAARFPGALLAFDTVGRQAAEQLDKTARRRNLAVRWAWVCDDPRALESLGLRLAESIPVTRPPASLRRALPGRYRWRLRLADPVIGKSMANSLFLAG